MKKKIEVKGVEISIEDDMFISLNEIIKGSSDAPSEVVKNWIKNLNTVKYLWAWEEVNNPDFSGGDLKDYIFKITDNRYVLSPTKWVKDTNARGMRTKMGRGGGTYVHQEIALEFCSWYDPYFKVYLMTEFQRLKEQEATLLENTKEWHISKIAEYVDNAKVLLEDMPRKAVNPPKDIQLEK